MTAATERAVLAGGFQGGARTINRWREYHGSPALTAWIGAMRRSLTVANCVRHPAARIRSTPILMHVIVLAWHR